MPSTKNKSWYEIKALANGEARVEIFEEIGCWGVNAKSFSDALKALGEVNTIYLHINSPGGSVFDGMAIFNILKSHPANVIVRVEGLAASMASVIMCAGNEIIIPENALVMIHDPMGGVYGNEEEMRKMADVLAKVKAAIVSAYVARSGRSEEEISAWMSDETWFTGAEAVEAGLADRTDQPVELAACAHRMVANFTKAPDSLKGLGGSTQKPPAKDAGISGVIPMPEPKKPDVAALTPEEIRINALADEKARRDSIRAKFGVHASAHATLLSTCLDDMDISSEVAGDRLLKALGESAEPSSKTTRVTVVTGSAQMLKHAEEVLSLRANLLKPSEVSKDNALRGFTLAELARATLDAHGVSLVGVDRLGMVGQAFTHNSGDFSRLLGNVAHKALLLGYGAQENTFRDWTLKGTLTDFRPASRVGLESFPTLDKVPEGGEYKYATIGDRGEQIQLATYGKLFSITRQAIINDDLQAFTELPMKMGQAAYRTINKLVYAILTGNPTMADGTALFHANHKNIATSAAPSIASLGAARALMRKQKDAGGEVLNIRPSYVICPVALEDAIRSIIAGEFDTAGGGALVPNPLRNFAQVISDAELDESSAAAWYMSAGQGYDTIEVAYLDGDDRPRLEQQAGWTVDGVEFKVAIDAGVKARDFRTMVKNAGG